jgi:hypothetical protein
VTKNTPLARAIRTFLYLLASSGAVVALAQLDWVNDWHAGLTTLGIGVLAAFIGAASAFLLAQSEWWRAHVTTAVGKALATAAQQLGAGLASVAIVSLDGDVLLGTGKAIVNMLVAAVVAFILSFATNAAEDSGGNTPVPSG